jgi:ABC-type transport system involved in multi-copper enzyme maturation permease subunit
MRAFIAIAGFEVRTRLARLSTWVYFVVFAALATLWIAAAGGVFASANIIFGSGKVWINSPYAIAQTVAVLGMIGSTVIAALAGRSVQQDFEYRSEYLFFTAPIGKWQYLGGRYAGAIVTLMLVFSSIAVGAYIGTLLPGIDPDRLGPFRLAAYATPYLTVLLPNLLWLSALFLCTAAPTRRMLPVYVGSVLCIIGYLIGTGLLRDLEYKTLAAMLDPYGVLAMSRETEYWTIAERNTLTLPFGGILLWNRLLWMGVGAALLAFCLVRFRFAYPSVAGAGSHQRDDDTRSATPSSARAIAVDALPVGGISLLPRLTWMYFRETVKSVYFGVIVFAGILFLGFTSTTLGSIYGTATWPVTYQMLELVSGTFSIFIVAIITFYAGELVWRERDNRFDQIHDALPVPTWLPFAGKLAALMLVPVVLQAVLLLCGVAIQTFKGYTHYEIGLYLHDLFGITLIDYWLLCVLAITVHSVVNQKYAGHFVVVVYFVALLFANALGFEHNLYKYASTIQYTYSDMNGFGHFMLRLRAFQGYYAGWAVLLAILALLLWTRGTMTGWRDRITVARQRLTPAVVALGGAAALATVALGGYIFYNTNVLNHYRTQHDRQLRLAEYEKRYKILAAVPQPKVTAVKVDVDVFPREQRVRMRGTLSLVNRNDRPVDAIYLFFAQGEQLIYNRLEFSSRAVLTREDREIGLRAYTLATPLAPGATIALDFDLELPTHGFQNTGSNTAVVYNGTFVNGDLVLPVIGYDDRYELESDQDRRKFGLAPKARMRSRDDPSGLARNYIVGDADWVKFDAEVTTDEGQLAIAPGYLQRDWSENGRHHFVYAMDAPILDFVAFQSARYAVRKDRWNDVAIEIDYQPGHEYNLDRMIAAVKASLDYYSAHFGPYQYRQFRIVEFPRYASFAQSFPNTIPFSEAIGFIARVRNDDKDDVDYPYYVTAHEAAHQWWAHQVVGANVQGATMLSETLAQYSALMVMKRKYGAAKMQKFLAYELDRYLVGRGTEQKKELPLAKVENQPYIHYRKGSLVMYALADYIGEENLDRAIRAFRDEWAYKGPPYPTTNDLLLHLRAATPPQYQYVIGDMFDSITLYDNRAESARAKALPDGKYEVTVKVIARKRKADDLGAETDVPLADWIDIGVLDADGNPLYLEKKKIDREESEFTVIVDGKPARAGIDPLNKLIDRRPKDNTAPVQIR